MPEAALPGATHPLPSPAIPHHSEATLIETPIQPSTDALRDPVCAVGLGSMAPGAPASQVGNRSDGAMPFGGNHASHGGENVVFVVV